MARPKKQINPEEVEKLAAFNCTAEEIASWFGVHVRTVERRFAGILKKGRDHGRMSLKRRMWETAQSNNKGSVVMQIWLSKNMLGYTDRVEQKTDIKHDQVIEIQWADNDPKDASPDAAPKKN